GEDSAFAKAVAEKLTLLRPRTTLEAAKIVEEQAGLLRAPVQDPSGRQSVHPATKTFQALRILVNGELESASQLLQSAEELLEPGGLLSIITFHSLEDDLVRRKLRGEGLARDRSPSSALPPFLPAGGREGLKASAAELARNPRSRSARL
ncbi:unnamed protein product, partial [Polarella glacialis]